MKKLLVALALTALAGTAYAGTIKPSQALSAQGSLVVVEGTATIHDDVNQAGVDVDLTGTDNSHMTAFIPQQSKNVFPALESFNGKNVDATGVVLFDHGKPVIRLMRPNQLKLAEP